MALISMAVYATEENNKTEIARRTIYNLFEKTDWSKHRLVVVNNASCDEMLYELDRALLRSNLYNTGKEFMTVIHNDTNLGTAGAINMAWKLRQPGECVVKMDDDALIHDAGWCDRLEEAIQRDPQIGIIGLKRKDLMENPWRNDQFKSELRMLPHEPGESWIVVEEVGHVMGTCQMYSPALLDKIGFLFQPRLYGFDDSLAAVRCRVAGFKNCFLPHIRIDHIDPGDTPFQEWKHKVSGEDMPEYNRLKAGYQDGTIPIYYNPYEQ